MDSKRNSLVDVTRMVCAFFVVAIHTNLGIENELTWILFQTIARIAVPYFLVVTGWFFYRNTLKNHRAIFKYIMNLLRAYLIASIPFAVVFVIRNNKSGTFFRELLVALMYVPTAIVVCTNILNEKWTGNISALSLNFKKASAFTYYYHPILISVFSKFVNNSYILFAIVSFVMFAINCIFQKSGSKFYKTITK